MTVAFCGITVLPPKNNLADGIDAMQTIDATSCRNMQPHAAM